MMSVHFAESSENLLKNEGSFDDGDATNRPACNHRVGQTWLSKSKIWPSLKFAVTIIPIAAIMWLLLVILARFVAQSPCECPFRLPTESLLGDIAWKAKVLDQDERFVTTDPGDIDGSNVTAIWGDIYPSAWIAVPDPSRVGFGGGVNLLRDAQDPGVWDAKTEGFSVAVMHQLHCIAVVKHSFMVYRRNEMGNHDVKIEHIDHCVEYLRQAIICHGDLTLERPETQTYPQGTTGWGNVHQCRDWDQLISVLRKLSIVRGDEGWIKAT